MSRTDQSAQAVGRCQSSGPSPRSRAISSAWSGAKRSTSQRGSSGRRRSEAVGIGGNVAPAARGAKAALTPPPATVIFGRLSRVSHSELRRSQPEEPVMAFTLPPLPYDYTALEPHIDEQTMRIHHDKHHATYVTNLNAALEPHADLQKKIGRGAHRQHRRAARGDPHPGAQQRRRPRQPHDVLGDDGAGRRQGAGRRAGGRDHQGVRRPGPVQGAVPEGVRRPVRQRLGLAGGRPERRPHHREHAQPGHARS